MFPLGRPTYPGNVTGRLLKRKRFGDEGVVAQFDYKDARSITKGMGRFTVNAHRERNGRYKTLMRCWWLV